MRSASLRAQGDEDSVSEPPRQTEPSSSRFARLVFVSLELIAVPFFLARGRGTWFNNDDWDFLARRTGGNLGDWFRGHFGHWVTLPFLVYRLLWLIVGLRSYVPYQVLAIAAHLIAVALLRAVMRRAGVGPWLSTIVAALMLFFGSGAENIVVAFQITFVGSLVFGLTQLLLADHDGPLDRRDRLALAAGFAGLLCSGVAIAMTLVVGAAVLWRRGWRPALFHTAPLAAAYGLWSVAAPKGQDTAQYHANSPVDMLKFVGTGLEAAFGRMGQVEGVGVVLAVLLVIGLATLFVTNTPAALRARCAAPLALLLGAVVFLALTGFYRSGNSGVLVFFKGYGSEHARQSRYVYLVVALTLPALALAADAIARRWHRLAIPLGVLLLVGLPGNLRDPAGVLPPRNAVAATRKAILTAPRLPLAAQLPRTVRVGPAFSAGPTIGWLLDNVPSGRVPRPKPAPTAAYVSTETLALALSNSQRRNPGPSCTSVVAPVQKRFGRGDSITVTAGSAAVVYTPEGGAPSFPRVLQRGRTYVALVSPLELRIVPSSADAAGAPVVCT